ncbi:MAG TPA: outer-membrane lipoprotein carrier protein LolA [Hyphomicrobiaceae bacterium]|jgi:outer membrane lipoprotein-sorting protein|nr:outer-membrane lipoprotein carrier protein LolA [Hyphomicrobiaceae bacterium]
MNARIAAQLVLLAALGMASASVMAQDAKKGLPTNPVGAGTWTQTVNKEPLASGEELDKKQLAIIERVNTYFNQMPDMKGNFVQTSADNKRVRGKFYVKRPGKFRFDYSPPSRLMILSDGDYLVIQDADIKTDDRVGLDQTPFRVLLRKDVDLVRDARILEVKDVDDVILVALQDKSPDAPGRIKIFLGKKPALELREWITTDSQGLDTRVELSELTKADDLDPNMFKPPAIALERLR